MKIEKSKLKNRCLIICLLLIISSCTIQKRLHSNGYHVEWKSFAKKDKSTKQYLEEKVNLNDIVDGEYFVIPQNDSIPNTFIDSTHEIEKEKLFFEKKSPNRKGQTHIQSKIDSFKQQNFSKKTIEKIDDYELFQRTATWYAILAHLGVIIVLLGFLMILNATYSTLIGSLVVIIGAILNMLSTLFGLFEIIVGDFGPLPIFAILSITIYVIAYLIFLLIEFGL